MRSRRPNFSFWNKQILRIRAAKLNDTSGGRSWLELAKWAEAAGLRTDAREALRRAGFQDSSLEEVRTLAANWNVSLAPWIAPHFSLATETSLFRKTIRDQQVDVEARPGFEFFLMPIRYAVDGNRRVLSRLILPMKDRSAYYGVYALHRTPTMDAILNSTDSPVYERMELKPATGGANQLSGKTTPLRDSATATFLSRTPHGPSRNRSDPTDGPFLFSNWKPACSPFD
ncbi:MAG: hypothetical protein IPK83_01220 [Planctomycetes bacterium]|nr:hypothetical protein [Planctomycetota bacterium]